VAWFRRRADGGEGSARRREEPAAPEPAPSSTSSPAPAEDEPAPFVAPRENRPTPGDWMAMPPMARTVGPPPSRLTNMQRISDMMTTRRPLALAGTLGHRVSPLAPAGSVEGLATAVDRPVEVEGGGGDLTLRAPVQRDVQQEVQHHVQREVPVTASATPSLPTISEARLPVPPPARALHEPLPLPGRDVGAEHPPRPLAVAQRQPAAASLPAPSPAPPATPGTDTHTDAPVGGTPLHPVSAPGSSTHDDPGGAPAGLQTGEGTVVDLPLAATGPAATSSSVPMEDVMPPIQPRAIQRRAAEAAGASARPETAADAPLPPLPDWARPAQPKGDDAVPTPSTPPMPLQHPTVQREAAPASALAASAASAAHADDAEDNDDGSRAGNATGPDSHGDSAAPAPAPAPEAPAPPARGGDAGTNAEPGPNNGTGTNATADADASAPLAGDAPPLAATGGTTELAADVTGDAGGDLFAGDDLDLPLHASAPSAPAAADTAADDGPPLNTWNAPSERMPSDRAPEPEPVAVEEPAIQRMADDSTASSADAGSSTVPLLGDRPLPLHAEAFGRAGVPNPAEIAPRTERAAGEGALPLPLAPDGSATGGPTLATPPGAPSAPNAPSAPSASSSPRALAAPPRPAPTTAPASTSTAAGRPLAGVQREPLAGGTTATPRTGDATASAGGVALPLRALPSVPERPAASPGTGGPLTDPLPVTPPAGAPPVPAMDAPLAMHAIPSMAGAAATAGTATATLPDTTTAALALPVQTQRAPSADARTNSASAASAAPMPLQAPVQRSADTSSATGAAGVGATGVGLSSASPSIGDLAIASGLAVRQHDGSVLFTRQEPPPPTDGAPVQRAIELGAHRARTNATAAVADNGGGGGDGGGNNDVPPATMPDLDLLARRLLPRFRRLLATEARTGRGRVGESPWNRH